MSDPSQTDLGMPSGRKIPIFVSLLIMIALTAVVPLVVSGVLTIRENRAALVDQVKKYTTRSAVSIAAETRFHVDLYRDQVVKMADSMRVSSGVAGPDLDPFVHIGRTGLIEAYRSKDPFLIAVRVINVDGQGARSEPVDLDPAVRELMSDAARMALSEENVTLSQSGLMRLQRLNDWAVLLSAPVEDFEGSLLGIVQGLVSLRPVQESLIEESRLGQTTFLVDATGALLLHGNPAITLKQPDLSAHALVAEFTEAPARLTRSYDVDGELMLGTVAPIGTEGWAVIVERPEAEAFASVDRVVRSTVLIGMVSLLLAIAMAAVFARRLTDPIRELKEKAREISAGNYGQQVVVASRNEIGELAAIFNRMSRELEKKINALRHAVQENHELFISSIRALAAAIDAKDPYTSGHSERVSRYSIIIAKRMGLDREEVLKIRTSALLHDVGKIGIDDRILRKPTALTDEEFEVMKRHPVIGAQIMEPIPRLRDIIPGMRHHHEKWEGGGYPDGIAGESIPMQARVIAVADTFDAMTTTRPYQKAMELSYVVTKIKSFAGTRFDPIVVEAFVQSYENGEIAVEPPRNVA